MIIEYGAMASLVILSCSTMWFGNERYPLRVIQFCMENKCAWSRPWGCVELECGSLVLGCVSPEDRTSFCNSEKHTFFARSTTQYVCYSPHHAWCFQCPQLPGDIWVSLVTPKETRNFSPNTVSPKFLISPTCFYLLRWDSCPQILSTQEGFSHSCAYPHPTGMWYTTW